ncbi:MAG: Fe-S cluster assembly protein SufD [Bauldia sp.]|nr:Fe-S cluster assembly protein SufD [Bauldia sp.]
MSVAPRSLKTEPELALAEQYRAARAILPGSTAVARKRDEAFAVFEGLGLPHRRVEAWKYTDLRALMRVAVPVADPPGAVAVSASLAGADALAGLDRHRLVIADGHFQEGESSREALRAEGVEVATLADFLAVDHPRVLAILDTPAGAGEDAMTALNAAMATDGVVVIVPAGVTVSKPIEIIHVSTTAEATASYARSAVQIGAGATATLVVTRTGPLGIGYQANTVLGLSVGEGGRATVVDIAADGDRSQHLATFSARIAAGATLDHLAVRAGAGLSRLQGFVSLEGEGAKLTASGANMLGAKAHGDVALLIDHAAPAATSRILYRNVAKDQAVGSFEGRILVQQVAQKTDGRMMTNTLILSDDAEFAAKPELEIYADDVQCGHGATTGQLDGTAVFYLQSRGVPRPEAEALLLRAFLAEPLETLGDAALAEALGPILDAWLAGAAD